jgi:hypothetical protein
MKELSNWLIGNGYKIANNNANAKSWYDRRQFCEVVGGIIMRSKKVILFGTVI